MSGDEPHRSRDARGSGRCRAPADAPPASCQTFPEASCAVSVQRAAAEHGEFLNGQKALRTAASRLSAAGAVPVCERAWNRAHWLLSHRLPVETGERSDGGGCGGYADAGDCRNCEGSWGTSSDHLYQMGGTERTDPHSVFCQALWPGADGWEDLWDMGS